MATLIESWKFPDFSHLFILLKADSDAGSEDGIENDVFFDLHF